VIIVLTAAVLLQYLSSQFLKLIAMRCAKWEAINVAIKATFTESFAQNSAELGKEYLRMASLENTQTGGVSSSSEWGQKVLDDMQQK